MIDTIVLRIHDTEKYRSLCRSLDMLDIKGTTNELGMVKSSEIRKLRRQGHKGNTAVVNILKINRTGEYLMKSKMAKHMNASSHYAFGYHINYAADYIEFNFSIPKYLFGSNIMMFVDHIYDKDYTYHNGVNLNHNIERSFDLLHKFLNRFFAMEFINIKIDYLDVEVNRIDVCFNQIFRSEQEALKYLEYQRRQHKKHSRDEEGSVTEYATSIMYTTQRYSAKIYHKGAEFRKNDAKEQQKINKEKGRQYFKIKEYQALADKILRYELTIRHT